VRVTSLRPSDAATATRAAPSWASPVYILFGLLALTGLTGLAALLTFARRDGVMFCPLWLGLLLASALVLVRHQDLGRSAVTRNDGPANEKSGQLLAHQRTFLQDAAHQLRTPITIALGHAELLASELAGHRNEQDIYVVVGELTRLRRLSERLLLIAASQDPEFLLLEPVALDSFLIEALRRWQPTARRVWATGRLDAVTVPADRERLGLAVDALLENAVQHTGPGDLIRLSVTSDDAAAAARLIVEDSGEGISAPEIDHIFERFRTGPARGGPRGTGLGLPLVRAVALGHAGEVNVHSAPGTGSTFELVLPATSHTGRYPGLRAGWQPRGQSGGSSNGEPDGATPKDGQPGGVPSGGRPGGGRWRRGGRWPRLAVTVMAMCAVVLAAVIAVDSTSHRGAPAAEPAAPPFTLPSLRDPAQMVSLSAYRGQPVILNFFASWCGPCERETPTLASFYRTTADKDVIIGVDADDSATAARHFVIDERVGYPIGFESTPAVADAYGVSGGGIPETFFLNASHHIVKRIFGDVTMAELTADTALIDGHNASTARSAGAANGDQNRG
jgi:signal transduction histidine kinase/thiol-disulfide isomerase/thioredoxin